MGSEPFSGLGDIRLCVNLDHVATVREARRTDEPDPVRAAVLALAASWQPFQATLVPAKREEITTEGGLDVGGRSEKLGRAVERLKGAGIRVSLFIDPDPAAVERSAELGADAVELHTGEYAGAADGGGAARELRRLEEMAALARGAGVAVHAGHGLTYHNVGPVAAIPECEELNIGHAIVSRAVLVGIEEAVGEMRRRVLAARPHSATPA